MITGKLVTLRVQIIPCSGVSAVIAENLDEQSQAMLSGEMNKADSPSMVILPSNQMSNDSPPHIESQFSLDQQNNQCQVNPKRPNSVNGNCHASTIQDADRLPKMSVARCSHGVVVYEKKLYIIGGYDRGECLDMCEIYDPYTNLMQTMEKNMENRRGRASIVWFANENAIYALGGSDGHEDLNSIECYNIEKA